MRPLPLKGVEDRSARFVKRIEEAGGDSLDIFVSSFDSVYLWNYLTIMADMYGDFDSGGVEVAADGLTDAV